MQSIALNDDLTATISQLADDLQTTKEDIVERAVTHYITQITSHDNLMDFAGTLPEDEADDLQKSIYGNRCNKGTEAAV